MASTFQLESFDEYPLIASRVRYVLSALPSDIQDDLMSDPTFKISLDDCEPGRGPTVVIAQLGPNGTSRCDVLKPRLCARRR